MDVSARMFRSWLRNTVLVCFEAVEVFLGTRHRHGMVRSERPGRFAYQLKVFHTLELRYLHFQLPDCAAENQFYVRIVIVGKALRRRTGLTAWGDAADLSLSCRDFLPRTKEERCTYELCSREHHVAKLYTCNHQPHFL
jgi:hypothetical protein